MARRHAEDEDAAQQLEEADAPRLAVEGETQGSKKPRRSGSKKARPRDWRPKAPRGGSWWKRASLPENNFESKVGALRVLISELIAYASARGVVAVLGSASLFSSLDKTLYLESRCVPNV